MAKEDWRSSGGYDLDAEPDGLEIVDTGYGKYQAPDSEDKEGAKADAQKARRNFILTISAIVIAGIAFTVLRSSETNQTESERLLEITTLDKATYLFADEDTVAVGKIRRRFGQQGDLLPFNDGILVTYLFLEHPVDVWVGIAGLQESAGEALSLLLDWTDPETNPDRWRSQSQFMRQGINITQVVGRGQRNYFYRDSNMIVWIAADSIAATFALNAALSTNLREWIASVRQGAP